MDHSPSHSRSASRRRTTRGSAIVELAVSLTFIVPTMLYASYLTEALYDGVKAEEATASAAWEFSGQLLHDYDSYHHSGKYSAAGVTVRNDMDKLYAGLEPWAVDGLGQSPTQLVGLSAKSHLIPGSAVCGPAAAGVSGNVQDPSNWPGMSGTLQTDLHTGGLITCQAQVEVTNWLWGKKTGQTSILGHQDETWPPNVLLSPIQQCGVGAATGGSCNNGQAFTMYTDDWGLAEAGDSNQDDDWFNYPDDSEENKHFVNLGQLVYENGLVPYPLGLQTAEAAASLAFCSEEATPIPIDPVMVLDKEYMGGTPHDTFNLSETKWQGTTDESMDTGSPTNNYESGIKQSSYTWPVRVYKAGPIGASSPVNTLNARKVTGYLGK